MKTHLRIIVAAMALASTTTTVSAQEDIASMRQEINELKAQLAEKDKKEANNAQQEKMWRSSSPMIITYGENAIEDEAAGVKYKSDLSVGFAKRHTYYLHNKAIAGMVKFGIDVAWTDFNFTRYAKGKGLSVGTMVNDVMGNVTSGNFNSYEDYFNAAYNNAQGAEEHIDVSGMLNRLDVGKYQLDATIIGLGPSVKIAPFHPIGKAWLSNIKVSGYFQYLPTMTTLLFSGDEKTVICGGYMSRWRYGANISFGRFGIGVEHSWGKGNLTSWNVDDDDDDKDGLNITDDKIKYITSGTRLYIGIQF